MEISIGLFFAIAASIAAFESGSMTASLLAFSAAGLGISITFLLLGSPYAAILLLVVETVVLAALIMATSRDASTERYSTSEMMSSVISYLFIAGSLVLSYFALRAISPFGLNVQKMGLDLREFDGSISIVVLIAAAAGALAVLRKTGRK